MVFANFIFSQNLLECKRLALCIYLETFGLHNKFGCLTDDSPDLCVHEEHIVHDRRLVGWLINDLAILIELWRPCAHDYHTLIKTVQNVFKVISFDLGFVSFREDSFAIAENRGDHLQSNPTIHQVKEDDHEPVRLHVEVCVQAHHQVDEQYSVSDENLDQVVAHYHRQEKDQPKLVER